MADVLTRTDLENAHRDATDLDLIVNGGSTAPDVPTRTGPTVPTVAKMVAAIQTEEETASASADRAEAAEAAVAGLVGLPQVVGMAGYPTKQIGRAITGGGIGAATGVIWVNDQPVAKDEIVVGASIYADTTGGDGSGYFCFLQPQGGSNFKLIKAISAVAITAVGPVSQTFAPFLLPAGYIYGWLTYTGAQIDAVTTDPAGANWNGAIPGPPAEGTIYTLVHNAFIIKIALECLADSLDDRVTALEEGIGGTATVADRVTGASASVAGFTTTIAGTLVRDGGTVAFGAAVTVAAAASGHFRYDTAYVDRSLTVAVVTGTERTTDPQEFIPPIGAPGRKPLFNLRVSSAGIEAVPIWNFDDGDARALKGALELDRAVGRRCLPVTISKIRRLAPLHFAWIGDSIGGMQDDFPTTDLYPDGIHRDRATTSGAYLNNGQIAADVLAGTSPLGAIPGVTTLVNSVALGHADDGAGAVHTKFGLFWNFVRELEKRGYVLGSSLIANNWAIATRSSAQLVSGSVPSPWLQAAIDSAPDLLGFIMGMNEYASPTTEANMKTALAAARAVNIECVVIGVPRKNVSQSVAGWTDTNRQLRSAAEYTGSAFVDLQALYRDENLGALGMSAQDICGSNRNNHPAIREHDLFNRYGLARLFFG